MANKLKTEVHVNAEEGVADIELELTPEQTVTLFEYVMTGGTAHISLKTPTNGAMHNWAVRENPAAYAVE